jgi:hypothetical protein
MIEGGLVDGMLGSDIDQKAEKWANKWAGWGECWYNDGRRVMGLF